MTFTNKSLHTSKNNMSFIKGATLFFLGMSCVMFATQAAFQISPIARNAQQLIQKIILTVDGSSTSATRIYLDGGSGNAYFGGSVGIGVAPSSAYPLNVIGTGKFLNNLLVSGYSFTSRIYTPIIISPTASPISFEDSSVNNIEYLTAAVINARDLVRTPMIISPTASPISFEDSSVNNIEYLTAAVINASDSIRAPIIMSPTASPISFEDSSLAGIENLTTNTLYVGGELHAPMIISDTSEITFNDNDLIDISDLAANIIYANEVHVNGAVNTEILVGTCTLIVQDGIIVDTTCPDA